MRCTFDIVLPVDDATTSAKNRWNNCLYSKAIDDEFCITAEVFRPSAVNNIKEEPQTTIIVEENNPTPTGPTYPIGKHDGNSVYGMACPKNVPQSGTMCGGWLPTG